MLDGVEVAYLDDKRVIFMIPEQASAMEDHATMI